jgi:hypothetical protein
MTEGVYDILLTDGIKHIFLSNEGMHDIPLIDKHIFRVCEGGWEARGGVGPKYKSKIRWSALHKE